MEKLITSERIKAALLWSAGLFAAVILGRKIGVGDYRSILVVVIGIGGLLFALLSGRFFWVIAIASSALAGTFPILGGSFTPFNLLMAVGVCKFFVEDVVLRRTKIQTGNRFDFAMIVGFMAILTIHALHDRLGMRFLGSTVWGGRNYVNVFVGLAAFFVIQSIPMKPKLWAILPYAILAVATFDLLIALITTIFPASIYKIYPFYSGVSRTGIEEIVRGDNTETVRLGSVGNFGVIMITLVLATTSMRRLLHPSNIFRAVTVALGSIIVLLSSFRTAVFNTFAVLLVAGVRDLKFKVLLLLPLIAVLLFGVSVINSDFVRLPKQVQRSLSFVPGNWDTDMAEDATSSVEWRQQVWAIWEREFFPAHPLLGRGFGFRSQWAQPSVFKYDPNAKFEMVEVGNIHNGFFAALDTFGIIGTLFFVIWNVRLLIRTFTVPFSAGYPKGMTLRFLALTLGASIICYWLGAQSVGSFLPQEFAIAAVFLRLRKSANSSPAATPVPKPQSDRGFRKELAPT